MAQWYDLTQDLYEGMPHVSGQPAPSFETIRDVEADGLNVTEFTAVTHVGTHIDAPLHFVPDGASIDELPMARFAGEGVVVDVSRQEPTEVTLREFREAPGEVRRGDIVLVHTGWGAKYGDDEYDPHPWLSTDLASWLVDQGTKLVGVDTITPDLPGSRREEGWSAFPVHRTLLGNDVLIAENLGSLDVLAGERLEVYGFPIKIRGGDGAQARFVGRTD